MARPLRLDFAGAVHHVTARGNERRPIFRSNGDRLLFLQLLAETVKRFGWSVTAWVLMSNHFHLVVETPDANLSRGMQWLMGAYAMAFNRRHRRSGHLFQGRFHSFLIDSDAYLGEVLRYVVLNPVRAGMVDDPAKYRWSSYRATAGLTDAPEWLDRETALEFFADDEAMAERCYQEFVRAAIGNRERLWDKAVNGIFLGTREWAKKMRKVAESRIRSTDHPKTQRAVGRPRMHTVIDAVARAAGVLPNAIRSCRGGGLRRLVAWRRRDRRVGVVHAHRARRAIVMNDVFVRELFTFGRSVGGAHHEARHHRPRCPPLVDPVRRSVDEDPAVGGGAPFLSSRA